MALQLPFLILSVVVLLLGISTNLAAALLGVELETLTQVLGLSDDALQALLFVLAFILSGLGIVVLRLWPRALEPMGAIGPHDREIATDNHKPLERVAHINDPLQSIYVAVMLISGVLFVSAIS